MLGSVVGARAQRKKRFALQSVFGGAPTRRSRRSASDGLFLVLVDFDFESNSMEGETSIKGLTHPNRSTAVTHGVTPWGSLTDTDSDTEPD